MEIVGIRTPGLGDTSYLLHHDGAGVLVDPQRDIDRFLDAAAEHGVEIGLVLETHVHNDYISGGRAAALRTGADLVLPAGAGAAFEHVPAFHQEDLVHRGLTVRPIHTPGHTPEHVAYLVIVDGEPVALFSGGSLLIGSAGRTDLLGAERARQLAKLQFHSIRRLAALRSDIGLYPTHGAGSFCAASGVGGARATIGEDRLTSPVLRIDDADEFVERQLSGLQPYPAYYAHMAPINLLGPGPMPALSVPDLSAEAVHALGDDVVTVDARSRRAFAAAHIPGSLGVELRDDFASWVGWLVPFDSPLVLILDPGQDAREPVVQLARIGFDRVRGVLRGLTGWIDRGYPVAGYQTGTVEDVARAVDAGRPLQLLDVRSPAEWEGGHLPGSVHRYVPDLLEGMPAQFDPREPVWLICGTGFRATAAAGLVERSGFRPVVVAEGGVADALRLRAALVEGPP